MAQAVLTRILNDINTLDDDELHIVVQAVQERLRQFAVEYSPEASAEQDSMLVLFAQWEKEDANVIDEEVTADD